MLALSKMLESVKKLTIGEVLYNMRDFKARLEQYAEDSFIAEDYFITPFYVHHGKRLELYWYELSIDLVDELESPHQILLRRTGRKTLEDIPKDLVRLHSECHIEVAKSDGYLPARRLLQYLDFLCSSPELASEVQKAFSRLPEGFEGFQYDNMWFAVY